MNRRTLRRWPSLPLALLAVALLAGCATTPGGADAQWLRETRDRAEIEALMWRYVRALDRYDGAAYAATFTLDGRFTAGTMNASGTAALQAMIDGLRARRDERVARGEPSGPMHHIITNSTLEFQDRDHARLNAYWMTVFEGAPGGATPRVAAAGRSVDELARVNGRWLIRARDVAPQD